MSIQPPFHGVAPSGGCTRVGMNGPCGAFASYHVLWTPERSGLCCPEHMREAQRCWIYYAAHPYVPGTCEPGSLFLHDENRCVLSERSESEAQDDVH